MRHLSEEELIEALAEGREVRHLAECAECRRSYLELARLASEAAAPPGPEPDWEAQRRAVMGAVAASGRRRLMRAAMAVAAAVVLAVGLTTYLGDGQREAPAPRQELARQEAAPGPAQAQGAAQEELTLAGWHPQEPLDEEFDEFMDFMIPLAEEDANETDGDVDVNAGGGPAAGGAELV